jgi:hypothetical protein
MGVKAAQFILDPERQAMLFMDTLRATFPKVPNAFIHSGSNY